VKPNKVWVTDITNIRTYEGWLYLAVVLDLFSRQVVGWSMKAQMTSDLATDALLMAVWRRKPKQEVMVHSDQGPIWQPPVRQRLWRYRMRQSMSRRGQCWDNAPMERVFRSLKTDCGLHDSSRSAPRHQLLSDASAQLD
jgi:putative transposase